MIKDVYKLDNTDKKILEDIDEKKYFMLYPKDDVMRESVSELVLLGLIYLSDSESGVEWYTTILKKEELNAVIDNGKYTRIFG